jgi:hypothetical protein
LITCLSTEIATSINIHVPFSKSRVMISGLLLGIVLFVCFCWFHNIFTYLHDLFRLVLIHGHTSVNCLILPLFPCICSSAVEHTHTHTLSRLFMYCSFAYIGHVDEKFSAVSSNCLRILRLLSVSVCNIFVPCYLLCNARPLGAITALSVSTSPRRP